MYMYMYHSVPHLLVSRFVSALQSKSKIRISEVVPMVQKENLVADESKVMEDEIEHEPANSQNELKVDTGKTQGSIESNPTLQNMRAMDAIDAIDSIMDFSLLTRHSIVHRGRRKSYDDFVRPLETAKPMTFRQRIWKSFRYRFCRRGARRASNQYRIPPKKEIKFKPLQFVNKITEGTVVAWTLLHYRTSFMRSTLLFVLVYFFLIYIYALWIRTASYASFNDTGAECLPGLDYTRKSKTFYVAFELSWNTFSTVGYGVVYIPAHLPCRGLQYVLATEAFIGVLYSGFCGAIFMAKISRNLVTAQVVFSSAVCLQYGKKLNSLPSKAIHDADSSTSPVEDNDKSTNKISEPSEDELTSFPFLEFRVVNKSSNRRGIEITNAEIGCTVASVKLMETRPNRPLSPSNDQDFEEPVNDMQQDEQGVVAWSNQNIPKVKRSYLHAPLGNSTHPHFGHGAWYFRHTLDHESPFLRGNVKRRIEEVGGWPAAWNDPTEMRSKLSPSIYEFSLIFTGISTETVNDVFKTQIFKPADIYIGWQFVSMSYFDQDSKIETAGQRWKVDMSLIHDIVPQIEGKQESLDSRVAETNILTFLDSRANLSDEDY